MRRKIISKVVALVGRIDVARHLEPRLIDAEDRATDAGELRRGRVLTASGVKIGDAIAGTIEVRP